MLKRVRFRLLYAGRLDPVQMKIVRNLNKKMWGLTRFASFGEGSHALPFWLKAIEGEGARGEHLEMIQLKKIESEPEIRKELQRSPFHCKDI